MKKERPPRRKNVLTEHEMAAVVGKEAAGERKVAGDQRKVAGDQRKETAGLRKETADQRDDTADQRENTANLRENTADLRQEAADQREDTADLRHEAANLRQEAADLREEVADLREEAERARIALSGQLREANEHLVIATVHAQIMTETAEQTVAIMTHMAEHDFLTGLPNRALLTDRLAQAMALAQRHSKKVALMYLDIDHFKHINDSLGHAIGDQLLQSVARRLQDCVRLSDTVSRQGGDEFVVLLPDIEDMEDAALTAQKLIDAVAKPHFIANHQLHVTLSIGISLYPGDGNDVETVLRNADIAMYQAKKSGRNKYKIFTPEMNTRAVARQSIEQALHHALKVHEFVLHYQPKVNLETGAITGAEALLRWQRTAHRLVSPAQFVSIAEECGLIRSIGRWVLREACRQTQEWLKAGLDLGQIAVNVSPVEFHGKDFLAGILTILHETGLDPHRLELELTESGMMQDMEQTTAILQALKKIGVQITVDDFGTGYSSLSYLHRFPIDTLKIDQSFVQDSDGEPIVSAVIAMGTSLKQRIVAEGIETKKQLAFLQSQQCAEGQGYYFGRPVAAEEFATMLVSGQALTDDADGASS
jgi:diguanylate cyclase (GGDEF)-like protein